MIRQHLQTEENFWPCVSDMFLALFVIALALYSVSSEEKGKGDVYIANLAKEEAISLIACMKQSYPHDEELERLSLQYAEETAKDSLDCPELSAMLYTVAENDSCKKHFSYDNVKDPSLWNREEPILKNACRALCRATGECFHEEGEYHQCIKEARKRVISALADSVDISPEALLQELERLKAELEKSKEWEDRYKALEIKYKELEARLEVMREMLDKEREDDVRKIAEQKAEIERFKLENESLKLENGGLKQENERLIQQIQEDYRKKVMQRVKELLKNYPDLYDGTEMENNMKVEVLEEEGVVRIPSTLIGFATSSVVPNTSGTCDEKQLESRLEHLAQFLDEVGKEVTKIGSDALLVDNISIECHSSPDGEGKVLGRLSPYDLKPYIYKRGSTIDVNNDWLSMLRAIKIWEILNERQSELKSYKNKKGLGLFSTTGCGARVCPKGVNPEARDQASLDKWRRIEIRFNCSPQRAQQPQTQN